MCKTSNCIRYGVLGRTTFPRNSEFINKGNTPKNTRKIVEDTYILCTHRIGFKVYLTGFCSKRELELSTYPECKRRGKQKNM